MLQYAWDIVYKFTEYSEKLCAHLCMNFSAIKFLLFTLILYSVETKSMLNFCVYYEFVLLHIFRLFCYCFR